MNTASPLLREWLAEAPFALAMSSGFFGFFAHAGALSALLEAGLVPARASGSSAGALVTGLWAGGASLDALRDQLVRLRRDDFWDPAPGLGVLQGRRFRALLAGLLPVSRIESTDVPWSGSVFDLATRKTAVLDRGDLATAIHASCAVPLLFHPVRAEGRLYADGGIADRPGVMGLQSSPRVLHHHLASRSPWRRAGGASMAVPKREGLVAVSIEALPRLGPFALDRGMEAFSKASSSFRAALDRPITNGLVTVTA